MGDLLSCPPCQLPAHLSSPLCSPPFLGPTVLEGLPWRGRAVPPPGSRSNLQQRPDSHSLCSRQATVTSELSHLPLPGALPQVHGQMWLGAGAVQGAWQDGKDVLHPPTIPGFSYRCPSSTWPASTPTGQWKKACMTGGRGRPGQRGGLTPLSPATSKPQPQRLEEQKWWQ